MNAIETKTAETINATAKGLCAKGICWSDDKAFIADVADAMGCDVEALKAFLLRTRRDGRVELARADLVEAMPAGKVKRSEATDSDGNRVHFVVV